MLALPIAASAQTSRAAVIAAAQAEKAKTLHPYVPNQAERILSRVGQLFSAQPRGWYPYLGGVMRGGWFAGGPAYRHYLGEAGFLDFRTAWSLRNYKLVEGLAVFPALSDGRLALNLRGQFIDAPRVKYYGVGNDTSRDDLTFFLYRPTTVGADAVFRPAPFVEFGAGYDYLDITTGGGSKDPSIEERFTPATAPGLGIDPVYTVRHVFAALNSQPPGYSRRGGLYRVDWRHYRQQGNDEYEFRQFDAEARQVIPIWRETWVLALRGLVTVTDLNAGSQIPYFLLPSLGGSHELRAYSSFRLRDQHRLLMNAEYRWLPNRFLDMAVFVDAGKVAARRADLNLRDLRYAYGIGVRLHSPAATPIRIEVGFGDEGAHLVWSSSASF